MEKIRRFPESEQQILKPRLSLLELDEPELS
jgi:hypothetical protein